MAVKKSIRFEVFKRDVFTCQYCGQASPAVILELDHVVPKSTGGPDSIDNLVTSCFECNRGKGANSLTALPLTIAKKAALLRERELQAREYEKLLRRTAKRLADTAQRIIDHFEVGLKNTQGQRLRILDDGRRSIVLFLDKLPETVILQAVDKALSMFPDGYRAWRYFCGICWNIIRGGQ